MTLRRLIRCDQCRKEQEVALNDERLPAGWVAIEGGLGWIGGRYVAHVCSNECGSVLLIARRERSEAAARRSYESAHAAQTYSPEHHQV